MVGGETRHQHQPPRCTFVSSGCICLTRQDVIELYGRVSCGALAPR
jgi:hypothetical protein